MERSVFRYYICRLGGGVGVGGVAPSPFLTAPLHPTKEWTLTLHLTGGVDLRVISHQVFDLRVAFPNHLWVLETHQMTGGIGPAKASSPSLSVGELDYEGTFLFVNDFPALQPDALVQVTWF